MELNNLHLGYAAAFGLLIFYLYRINQQWKYVPKEHYPGEWTVEEINEGYERLKKNPADFTKLLPPKLDRRYVVVGGSGLFPPVLYTYLSSERVSTLTCSKRPRGR